VTAPRPQPRIGLVLHPTRDPGAAAERLVAWAHSHDSDVFVREQDAARCPDGVHAIPEAELVSQSEALVSLGGDGTLLGALRLAAGSPVPVLGVNLGHLGFLVEVEPHELPSALDRIEAGDFTVEEHSAVVAKRGKDKLVAFNDLALARVPGEGVVRASLEVDGRRSGLYRCDAIVISTALGSTAYAYAAGGPVVSPALDAVIVAPAAPQSGISRPMVLSGSEPITLRLDMAGGAPALEVDGTAQGRCTAADPIEVHLQSRAGLVVRLDAQRHLARNQLKLSLLDLPFLPEEIRDIAPGR